MEAQNKGSSFVTRLYFNSKWFEWYLRHSSDQSTTSNRTNNRLHKSTNKRLTRPIDGSKRTNHLLRVLQPITWQFNWPIGSITRDIPSTDDTKSLWLWRWLPLRLSKRQSLSPRVLFRTTLTRTITLDKLKTSLLHWNYLLSSVATDGKDGNELKLEKCSQKCFKFWNTLQSG